MEAKAGKGRRKSAGKEKWDWPVSRKVYDEVMGIARDIAAAFGLAEDFYYGYVKHMMLHGTIPDNIHLKNIKSMCMALLPYILRARERSRRARVRAEERRNSRLLAGCVEGADSECHGQVGSAVESGVADDGKHLLALGDGGDAAVEVVVGSGVAGKNAPHRRDYVAGIKIVKGARHRSRRGRKFKYA